MSDGADPRATIEAAMAAFSGLPRAERLGRVSLWTMYYLGALVVPAIAEGVRSGRVPPTAIEALTCTLDGNGHVAGFRPRGDGAGRSLGGFDELVTCHLAVLIAACADLAGFPARVAWSNAAVTIDYAVSEARRAEISCGQALGDAEALIAGDRYPQLARPFRRGARRERRVCCLRYLLPDGTLCVEVCPRALRSRDSPCGNDR